MVLQRPEATAARPQDATWTGTDAASNAEPADCVPVAATDPLYILYTSGTTGRPKGVVRDNGGHAVALRWSMRSIYDIGPGEVFWAASDVGWVVGHSYIVYAPLLTGCDDGAVRGQAGRYPGRRRVLAGGGRARGQGAVHRADRVPRDQEGGPGGELAQRTTCPASGTCSWRASGSTRRPTGGRASCSASRWSTTGGRPRPAGRSWPTCAAWSRCRSRPVRRRCRCPATTCGSSTPTGPRPPGEEGDI